MSHPGLVISALLAISMVHAGWAASPRVLIDGCRLEQVAREPDIVTPVGLAFDCQGRLLVVESHTHQRPDGYDGPEGDRLRMLSDSDADGVPDRWSTFAEGFRHAMNVVVQPDGAMYLVTRSDVHLLQDADADDQADANERIVRLETTVDYPHNALSGIVVDGEKLLLGVGENFGATYNLVGSDGQSIENVGGVGTIYSCNLDGSGLKRIADGFWNPFSLCMAEGNLFCVDNDPDASPPCRLIHVQEMGDYGFRFEFGRAGVHPLQAWNGELPGTLPMVCGTGEAPTAVLFHRGYLWVTSWGDYRIERYELRPLAGGVYSAERTVVVQGDADFRPTGMAVAPDGSLWFADWVDRSYPVHGKGRIWRLELPENMKTPFSAVSAKPLTEASSELAELKEIRWQRNTSDRDLADILRDALKSEDSNVRLYALRWLAEEHLTEMLPAVEQLLELSIPDERYFLAVLATIDWLSHEREQRHSGIADGLLFRELRNPRRSNEIKALALNLISPDYKDLTPVRFEEYLASDFHPLRIAAARTLAMTTDPERFALLVRLAQDKSLEQEVRAEAVAGLAPRAVEYSDLLKNLAASADDTGKEAARILRLTGIAETTAEGRPEDGNLMEWIRVLEAPGDSASGRRIFYSATGPRCGVCHRHDGRGGTIGPDLSQIGKATSRERVITSILDPSREVAPHYETWVLVTDDGRTYTGQRLPLGGDSGIEPYADTSGGYFELPSDSIVHRQTSKASIMPAGLEKNLTVEDLRDLVTFLMEQ